MILITGASGMLGSYVKAEFEGNPIPETVTTENGAKKRIITLGRTPENDIVCDLSSQTPVLGDYSPETVIHCAGTENDSGANDLNFDGTKRLCMSLENNPPKEFVYVSSYKV